MRLRLSIESAPAAPGNHVEAWSFTTAGGTIGRSERNDWRLPDPGKVVSSTHARITCDDGVFAVTDLSTNGLFLNGAELPIGRDCTVPLRHGDRLRLGDYELLAELEDAALPPWPGAGAQPQIPTDFNFDLANPSFANPSLGGGTLDGPLPSGLGGGFGSSEGRTEAASAHDGHLSIGDLGVPGTGTPFSKPPLADGPFGDDRLPDRHLPEDKLPEDKLPEDNLPENMLPENMLPDQLFADGPFAGQAFADDAPAAPRSASPRLPMAGGVAPAREAPAVAGRSDLPVTPRAETARPASAATTARDATQPSPRLPPTGEDAADDAPLTAPTTPGWTGQVTLPTGSRSPVSPGTTGAGSGSGGGPGSGSGSGPNNAPTTAQPPAAAPVGPTVSGEALRPLPVAAQQPRAKQRVAPAPDADNDDTDPGPVPVSAPLSTPAPRAVAGSTGAPAVGPQTSAAGGGTPEATQAGMQQALAALFEGAGVPDLQQREAASPALFAAVGRLIALYAAGSVELVQSVSTIRDTFRIHQTQVRQVDNNPLRWATPKQAVRRLLAPEPDGFLPPEAAIEETMTSVVAHQIGVIRAMEASFRAFLDALAPEQLEQRFASTGKPGLMTNRKAWLWEQYAEHYRQLADDAEDNWLDLLGDDFVLAYEQKVRDVRAQAHATHHDEAER